MEAEDRMGATWCEPPPLSHLGRSEPLIAEQSHQRCCRREGQDAIVKIASSFAVLSPNLLEMQAILGAPQDQTRQSTETAAQAFYDLLPNPQATAVIVRAGAMGSYTLSKSWTGWIPAYWTDLDQDKVIDPTGGGNSWLGGLLAGLLSSDGDMKTGRYFISV